MAITWDATTTANITTAFTTPQTIPHVVGGLDDRRVFALINTEDFSTGGGGQQPTSVTFNGNALIQDAFAVSGATSTSMIYSGLDADMGAAGSKDLVITFAGHVERMIVAILSASGMEQAAKEATGSLVQLASGGVGTSNITTVNDEAIIIATFGEGAGNGATWTINVGTEVFDLEGPNMSAVGIRYEKAVAGAQAMTATSTKNGGRLTGVSVAYTQITAAPPVMTVPGAQQAVYGVQLPVSGIFASDADTDIDGWVLSCTAGMTMTVTLSGAVTIDAGANNSPAITLAGTQAELNTVMGTLRVDRIVPANLLTGDTQDTITLTVNDSTGNFDTDNIVVNWSHDSGVGKPTVNLSGTAAQIIDILEAGIGITPSGGFTGALTMGMVSDAGAGLTDADLVSMTVQAIINAMVGFPATSDFLPQLPQLTIGAGLAFANASAFSDQPQTTIPSIAIMTTGMRQLESMSLDLTVLASLAAAIQQEPDASLGMQSVSSLSAQTGQQQAAALLLQLHAAFLAAPGLQSGVLLNAVGVITLASGAGFVPLPALTLSAVGSFSADLVAGWTSTIAAGVVNAMAALSSQVGQVSNGILSIGGVVAQPIVAHLSPSAQAGITRALLLGCSAAHVQAGGILHELIVQMGGMMATSAEAQAAIAGTLALAAQQAITAQTTNLATALLALGCTADQIHLGSRLLEAVLVLSLRGAFLAVANNAPATIGNVAVIVAESFTVPTVTDESVLG